MFESDKTLQPQLFAFTPRDMISEKSDVWLYIDLFESLSMKRFNQKYRGHGQVAKDPRLMLRTIFYGLTHGVVTGRKLESACRNDVRYMVLSGDTRPDRRTLDRFIRRHEESIKVFFVDVVRVAQRMGLVSLGRVAVDGSRFKGNTSRSSMEYGKMNRAVGHIQENLERLKEDLRKSCSEEPDDRLDLPKEIENQERRLRKIKQAALEIEAEHKKTVRQKRESPKPTARKSLNDPEALHLAHKSQSTLFGYNVQAAVDADNQIIVAAELHHKATDYEALPVLLDQIEENCGGQARTILADVGYASSENVREVESRNALPVIAPGSDQKELEVEFFEQITPTENPHRYTCMRGKALSGTRRKNGRTDLYVPKGFCLGCEFSSRCKGYGKRAISIRPEEDRLAMKNLYERARSPEFKEIYRKRKAIVEPIFGNIKNKGMKILVTGKKKVKTWWLLACTAHNIEKLVKSMTKAPLSA